MARTGVNDGYGVVGLPEIQAKMERIPQNLRKNILRRALYAGAVIIRDSAREKVRVRFGALRKKLVAKSSQPSAAATDIVASVGVSKGHFSVILKQTTRRLGGGAVQITTKLRLKKQDKEGDGTVNPRRYAHLIELGTSHSPAFPFLRPAAETNKEKVVKRVGDTVWAGVKADAEK